MSLCSKSSKARLLSPEYIWVVVISIAWLVYGGCLLSGRSDFRPIELGVFLGVLMIIIPFGVFFRKRWGFYSSFAFSCISLIFVPLGTIIGALTIKALVDCKNLFFEE